MAIVYSLATRRYRNSRNGVDFAIHRFYLTIKTGKYIVPSGHRGLRIEGKICHLRLSCLTGVQLVEAEKRQTAIYRLMFDVTNDVTERRVVGASECQRLIRNHLTVSLSASINAHSLSPADIVLCPWGGLMWGRHAAPTLS